MYMVENILLSERLQMTGEVAVAIIAMRRPVSRWQYKPIIRLCLLGFEPHEAKEAVDANCISVFPMLTVYVQ